MKLSSSLQPLTWNSPLGVALALGLAFLAGVLLVQFPPYQGLVVVSLGVIVIGTAIEPFVGLATALFLGPLKAYISAEIAQIPAQVAHAFIALALGSWLARRLSKRDIRIRPTSLLLSLAIFIGATLFSLWDATGRVAFGTPELVKWIEVLLLFILVSHHLVIGTESRSAPALPNLEPRGLYILVFAVLGTGLFQAGVGIWQFALRSEGPEHFAILGSDFFRAYGTFEQPNPYAGYLGLTAALALGVVAEAVRSAAVKWSAGRRGSGPAEPAAANFPAQRPAERVIVVFAAFVCLVMLVALVASWSRGAWIGFGAAVLSVAFSTPRRARWGVLLAALLIMGTLGLYASGQLPTSFTARLTSFLQDIQLQDVRGVPINDANYAVVERLAHWQSALSMFRYNFWLGVGFGCYEAAYSTFALINWPIALGHAHNYYLNLVAETGLLGLIAYVALWGVILWQTWQATRRAQGLTRGLSIGLLGTWVHISVHHLLDNLYVNNVHLQIGVLLGILAFIGRQTSDSA